VRRYHSLALATAIVALGCGGDDSGSTTTDASFNGDDDAKAGQPPSEGGSAGSMQLGDSSVGGDVSAPNDAVANTDSAVPDVGPEARAPDAADDAGFQSPTAFRSTSWILIDPHIWPTVIGCNDVTTTVNTQTATSMNGDANADGFYDLSYLFVFRPLAQASASSALDFGAGNCKRSVNGCSGQGATLYSMTGRNKASGVCLAAGADHSSAYLGINTPTDNCFATDAQTVMLPVFFGLTLPFYDTQVAAVYNASPATGLATGLFRGFLRKTDADAYSFPNSTPTIGGLSVSSVLGSDVNCPTHNDLDSDNGTPGWWFYFNFTAIQVPYSD